MNYYFGYYWENGCQLLNYHSSLTPLRRIYLYRQPQANFDFEFPLVLLLSITRKPTHRLKGFGVSVSLSVPRSWGDAGEDSLADSKQSPNPLCFQEQIMPLYSKAGLFRHCISLCIFRKNKWAFAVPQHTSPRSPLASVCKAGEESLATLTRILDWGGKVVWLSGRFLVQKKEGLKGQQSGKSPLQGQGYLSSVLIPPSQLWDPSKVLNFFEPQHPHR